MRARRGVVASRRRGGAALGGAAAPCDTGGSRLETLMPRRLVLSLAVVALGATVALRADESKFKFKVHDMDRPQPRKVVAELPQGTVAAPSDAVVLFSGKDLGSW